MKVLFFNYEYPPLGGGAANATAYLMREFSRIPGLKIDLVTSSVDANYHLEKIGEQVKIHRLPIGKNEKNLHFQSQKDLMVYAWKAFRFSRKLIRKNGYSLSHSFFTVPCGFLSWLFFRKYKIPYIVSLRGSDVPGYSDRFVRIYKILTPLIKLIWNQAAYVIANSQGLKELALQSKTKKAIEIIYNGIDTNHFSQNTALRPKDKFIITTGASRVTHRKGLNYLIEAAAELAPKYPNIQVKIMGDGNAKEELESLAQKSGIENKVEFLGRIPREKTAPFYQEASLFVLPSLNEGMSNAMLEALAVGLPLIATDTGGSSELVKDSVNGYIVKFKDSADIAEKIEKIISNPELAESMSVKSRKIAEGMNWANAANRYLKIYQQTAVARKKQNLRINNR